MNATALFQSALVFMFLLAANLTVSAQRMPIGTTESNNPIQETPRDDIYERHINSKKLVIPYDFLHEKDVFWEKRVWRLIDVREKQNHHFAAVATTGRKPFIMILLDHARKDDIAAYSVQGLEGADGDNFSNPIPKEEMQTLGTKIDTVVTFDPETLEEIIEPVVNPFNPEDVRQFRLKEVWFFDEETSAMDVRILGIAPIQDRYDDNGNFLNSGPMFWVYYPDIRPVLAQHACYNPTNDLNTMSWEDVFEARHFSSYIIKESNVHDRRIQDYKSGVDALLEADKIKEQVRDYEHDLWTY